PAVPGSVRVDVDDARGRDPEDRIRQVRDTELEPAQDAQSGPVRARPARLGLGDDRGQRVLREGRLRRVGDRLTGDVEEVVDLDVAAADDRRRAGGVRGQRLVVVNDGLRDL